jgi:large subunit ribosomal protein L35
MPKMKTHKGAAKRFKRTASGKLKRNCAGRRHLMDCKSTKRKRNLRGGEMMHPSDLKRFKHLIPF